MSCDCFLLGDGMSRSISISFWFIIGFILGAFLLQVLFALLFAGAGLPFYYGDAILIGIAGITLSFCAAYFNGKFLLFIIGYTLPFALFALFNTVSFLYVQSLPLNIRVVLSWWGFATLIFLIGSAGGRVGKSLRKRRGLSISGAEDR